MNGSIKGRLCKILFFWIADDWLIRVNEEEKGLALFSFLFPERLVACEPLIKCFLNLMEENQWWVRKDGESGMNGRSLLFLFCSLFFHFLSFLVCWYSFSIHN